MIELQEGHAKAQIDLQGGWLTALTDNGDTILFPRRIVTLPDGSTKQRGGCHVCLPNFGPGGASTQPQHGFGRTSLWQLQAHTANTATLVLKNGPSEYEHAASMLFYALRDHAMTITLRVANTGASDMRIAPGFHPYFALTEGESTVTIDNQTKHTKTLKETRFVSGSEITLRAARRPIVLASDQLHVWAQWSDNPELYVCVEPTLGGYMFLKELPDKKEILAPRETRQYDFSISWG